MKNKYQVTIERKQTKQIEIKEIILKPQPKQRVIKPTPITVHPHTEPIRIPDTVAHPRTSGKSWKFKHTNKPIPKRQFQKHPRLIEPDIKRIAEIAYTIEDFTKGNFKNILV